MTESESLRYALCVLLSALCSCAGLQTPHGEPMIPQGDLSYCGLLNVPSMPYPAHKPRPYLGIYLESQKLEHPLPNCKENTFVKVAGVIYGTPAADSGLKEGDVITVFNGIPTCFEGGNITESFKNIIEQQKIGSIAKMEILRGVQEISVSAKLSEMPTIYQPEADHRDIECPGGTPSRLEKTLQAQNVFPLFRGIADDLYRHSNFIHNPALPEAGKIDSLQSKEMTFMMRHPLSSGLIAGGLTTRLAAPFHKKDWSLMNAARESVGLLDIELSSSQNPGEITFPELLRIMEETKNRVEEALSNLTGEEKAFLREKALNPSDDEKWNRMVEISLKLDRKDLLDAFSPILSFLTLSNLSLLKEDIIRRFGNNKGPILHEEMTPFGKVIIGGMGPNVYAEDAALVLDLGGDDLYLNNAGGTRPGMHASLVIDWGGNDRYITKEDFSQGAGVLGGGFLLDLGGSDTFVSSDGSQGAGLFGIGMLYHGGSGNSNYYARSFSQGVGRMGIGLIFNESGNDIYLCSHDGQALGLFGGAGILIDQAGNDHYQLGGLLPDFRDPLKSTVSMGQGFGKGIRPERGITGVPGGAGILIDEAGDDVYIADYFAQGSSYYYGLGILNDMSGNDEYIAARYAQGAGIHSSVGVFMDRKGDDFYYASYGVGQGMGHDFGVGYFEDKEGDDRYWGGTLVQGAATRGGIGIFLYTDGKVEYAYSNKSHAFAQDEECMGIAMQADEVKLGFKESRWRK